jgi:hypothetical protein
MSKMRITVSVSRTIQTAPYESSKIEVTQEVAIDSSVHEPEKVRVSVYKAVSHDVERFVNTERRKYAKDDDK